MNLHSAADEAHGRVLELRDEYGRPTARERTDEQPSLYEKARQL
ncbi:hypothetical protein [Streptomyces sp. NPDC018610]